MRPGWVRYERAYPQAGHQRPALALNPHQAVAIDGFIRTNGNDDAIVDPDRSSCLCNVPASTSSTRKSCRQNASGNSVCQLVGTRSQVSAFSLPLACIQSIQHLAPSFRHQSPSSPGPERTIPWSSSSHRYCGSKPSPETAYSDTARDWLSCSTVSFGQLLDGSRSAGPEL